MNKIPSIPDGDRFYREKEKCLKNVGDAGMKVCSLGHQRKFDKVILEQRPQGNGGTTLSTVGQGHSRQREEQM